MSKSTIKDLGLILLATVLALIAAWFLYHRFASIGTDGTTYALLGKNLAETGKFEVFGKPNLYFSPFLPMIISVFFWLSHNIEHSVYLSMVVFGVIATPLLYFLSKMIIPRKVAVSAAVLLALNGNWILSYSTSVSAQVIVGTLSILLFMFLIKIDGRSVNFGWRQYLLLVSAGAMNGIMYLTRPEYFFIIFPVLIYITAMFWQKGAKAWIKAVLFVCIGFMIISLPYLIFLHKNLGTWTISGRTFYIADVVSAGAPTNISAGNGLYTDVIDKPALNSKNSLLSAFWHNKKATIKRMLKGLRDSERNLVRMFGFLGIGLATFGIRELLLKKRYRELAIMGIMFLPIIAIAFGDVGGATGNYLIQFIFWFLLLAAVGFWSLYDEMGRSRIGRMTFSVLALLTLAYLFFPVIQTYLFLPPGIENNEYKYMGLWMKDNIPDISNQLVLSRKPEFSLYAGSQWAMIPNVPNLKDMIGIMEMNNIRYLLADTSLASDRPQFLSLLNKDAPHSPFKIVHTEVYYGRTVILYTLNSIEK